MNSFPSGHMAITAALAVATAIAFPRLRYALWAYVAAIAFSRVMFGAHFPLDVVAGTALGIASALLVAGLFRRLRRPTGAPAAGPGVTPSADPLPAEVVAAVMPSYNDVPTRGLVEGVLAHVGRLVLVDDGSDPTVGLELDRIAAAVGAEVVHRDERGGKGTAVRTGVDHLLDGSAPPEAVLVLDADGQHPASAIPQFVAAGASADLVIGDRFGDLRDMPLQRRLANLATSRLFQLTTGRVVRDTQNGMRLYRPGALATLPAGGYEAETAHLRRVLLDGLRVAWVPMPAIYQDEESSFRPGSDSAKVIWAILRPTRRPSFTFSRTSRRSVAAGRRLGASAAERRRHSSLAG
jgi:dolichol-phosphate mannosyltransferase